MAFTFMELLARFRRHVGGLDYKHADSSLTFTDITTNNATTSAHGFMPKGTGSTTTFFRSDMTQAAPVGGPTIAAEQATASGTSIDFTGIPSTAKRITVMLNGVSTNGTSPIIVQLGKSGGVETSGYAGGGLRVGGTVVPFGAGFQIVSTADHAATSVYYGQMILSLEDSSDFTWVCSFTFAKDDGGTFTITLGAGRKATAAVTDRIRLTTVNGTDAFDAGVMSISYE